MKWRVLTIGKPALRYTQAGSEEYLKRLRKYAQVELVHLKAAPEPKATRSILDASEGSLRIVLDERGRNDMDTKAFAKWVADREMDGATKQVSVLIGGSDGHSKETRQTADLILTLSPFTLQHELALVVFLEQLYRVCSLRAGAPYHREG